MDSSNAHELERQTPIPPARHLHMLQGGVMLGRATNMVIDESDFRANNAIIRMSAAAVAKQTASKICNHRRQEYVVSEQRSVSTPPEIVKAVLTKTHRSLGEAALTELKTLVDQEYVSYEDELQNNGFAVIAQSTSEQAAACTDTDLLRGMNAFAEATQEQWGKLYDDTVLAPALTFARWLILVETSSH